MAVRGIKLVPIEQWLGYDGFTDAEELPPNAFSDSLNVVVSGNGNPTVLRSPADFNPALSTSNKVISGAEYDRTAGGVIVFDINASSGANVATYATSGGSNTLLRSSQADARWVSLNANDALYRVNGTEFIQYVTSFAAYAVGITKPSNAPTLTLTTGGSGVLTTGVYASYAYYNAGTGHIGECSASSGPSGSTSGGAATLALNVTASAQTGVTNIVVFVSQDAGTLRYLLIDSAGDIRLFSNATATITVSLANVFTDLNTEETVLNAPPVSGITHISKWKNRIMAAVGRLFRYSGFDQIAAGVPQEAWPPLNFITVPSRGETAKGGIETPIGWLGFSDRDNYLLSGEPTDKVDSGENTNQITEQFDQLGWGLGTLSPSSVANTPYGTVWLDKDKHLQFWRWEGRPVPAALGIWPDLAAIQDSKLDDVSAVWFPMQGAAGGYYVLTGSTTGSVNNRCWIVLFLEVDGTLRIVPCPSSIAAESVFTARFDNEFRCFIGVTDRVREILDFSTAGAGWGATDRIYMQSVAGNHTGNYSRLHAVRIDGTNAQDAVVRVSNLDGSLSETLRMEPDSGDFVGLADRGDQPRHRLTLEWPTDDAAQHNIKNLRLALKASKRVI